MDTDKIVAAILTAAYVMKTDDAENQIVEKYYSIRAALEAKKPEPNAMSITGKPPKR